MKKFPIGLTISTAIAFAILCGLGGWQLKRLAWKQDLLARIEALKTQPARPLGPVLLRAKAGEDVAWMRVSIDCAVPTATPRPDWVRNSLRDGQIVWRVVSACQLPDGSAWSAILVDRGTITAADGAVKEPSSALPPVGLVEGVLAPVSGLSKDPPASMQGSAPLILMVEREKPAAAGITPSPLPPNTPNRHLEYALTWFGLAGALVAVYAALLRRRLKAA